jgi:nucleotide-binding universal stress UspA family protein
MISCYKGKALLMFFEVRRVFKKILHPTDFSEVSLQAFDQAVALALRYGAKLRLLHAMVLHQYDGLTVEEGLKKLNDAYDSLRSELKNQMEEMVEHSEIAHDLCTISIKRGFSASEVILGKAEESGADLIVMGTHGRSPVRRFFLGSEAEKVVRYAPCPVMVVGKMEDAPGRFKRILLPVDFSKSSHTAARLAFPLAKKHRAELHVIHVYQNIIPPTYYGDTDDAFEWDPELKKRGEKAAMKFLSKHRIDGVEITTHFAEGSVSKSIADAVHEHNIDLIVMGTAGLRGMNRFMVGSVTEKVLRNADVPVLTVRPGDNEGTS